MGVEKPRGFLKRNSSVMCDDYVCYFRCEKDATPENCAILKLYYHQYFAYDTAVGFHSCAGGGMQHTLNSKFDALLGMYNVHQKVLLLTDFHEAPKRHNCVS